MYTIPNIYNPGGGSPSGGPGSELINTGQFNFTGMGGSSSGENQFMGFPAMTSETSSFFPETSSGSPFFPMPGGAQSAPGIVPPSGAQPPLGPFSNPADTGRAGVGGTLPGGVATGRTIDPQQTEQWAQYLMSQLGMGVTPFNLSAILPSTGKATAPGTLTAPENPVMQALQQFYTTGTGGPLPGILPMWNTEMQAMNIPIQQQLANIKEQFGAQGALGSSEMANALANYGEQTSLQQEALLGQLTQQALPGMQSFAGGLQQLDQSSINNLLQEFIRTQPQYNPMVGLEQQFATTFPPLYNKQGGTGSALLGSSGNIMSGLAALIPVLAGLCWVSAEVFDEDVWHGRRTSLIRNYLINHVENTGFLGTWFVDIYRRYGKQAARAIREDSKLRTKVKDLFEQLYELAHDWRFGYASV